MTDTPPNARAARTSVMLRAELFRMGQAGSSLHRVLNLSATGMCIAAPELTAGSTVLVSIGEVRHAPADIAWVRESKAGLRFRTPLDVAAARRPRPIGSAPAPAAGWMAELDSPYRQASTVLAAPRR